MERLGLEEAQRMVDEWIHKVGGKYFSELTNMALLTEETGELARVIARVYGDQIAKEGDLRKSLAEEMADVLWVLICLANQTGVDLTSAFMANIEKKYTRDRDRFAPLREDAAGE
ncbi:MAG: nucleotide pyrophosphohydrolase [Muribaculaceae bacterium]|nr:nucleotide pyrophosphohydrolase [Muribaculaceae bacterium]MDE6753018.1 nucleotide pyrophosphohydrolase [Muribaculaceae bacterium]